MDYLTDGEFDISGMGTLTLRDAHIENAFRVKPIIKLRKSQNSVYKSYPSAIHSGGKVVVTASKLTLEPGLFYDPDEETSIHVEDVAYTNNAIDYLPNLKLSPNINYVKSTTAPRFSIENCQMRIADWYHAITRTALNAPPLCTIKPEYDNTKLSVTRSAYTEGGAVTIKPIATGAKNIIWNVPVSRITNWETFIAALFFDTCSLKNNVKIAFYAYCDYSNDTVANGGTLVSLVDNWQEVPNGMSVAYPLIARGNIMRLKELKAYQTRLKYTHVRIVLDLLNMSENDTIVVLSLIHI